MRIFALSDVHLDYESNARWLFGLSTHEYTDDVLILAGDVSDDVRLLEQCFRQLSARFRQVLYVPGNHDLWIIRWDKTRTSLDKYRFIGEMARGYNVSSKPFSHGPLTIVPLLSWYDYSFGAPAHDLESIWMDYHACAWPANFTPSDVTRYFLAENEPVIGTYNTRVISFSHFLPRIDVMPIYIPPAHRKLYPVLGTALLDTQIRALRSTLHIYGHSHVNRRVNIDGVTYMNNAFGYPSETRIAAKDLLCVLEI